MHKLLWFIVGMVIGLTYILGRERRLDRQKWQLLTDSYQAEKDKDSSGSGNITA
jgi:hypothetical protein